MGAAAANRIGIGGAARADAARSPRPGRKHRRIVALTISGFLVAACSPGDDTAAPSTAAAADSRPNVVPIVADDAGYADFGDPEMPTPAAAPQEGYTPTAANAPSTDVYVATLSFTDGAPAGGAVSVGDVTNITDRDGYDNQPAFEPGGQTLLYTSARNQTQTDIYRHDVRTGTTRQVTQTLSSEFSATPLPSGDGFSSIHESAAAQQLWRFDDDGTSRGGILDGVQPVGYHAWADENMVVMFVLGGDGTPATLQLGDLRTGEAEVLAENPGRSLHKIPGRRAVSFVRKIDEDNWWIEAYDLDSGEFTRLLPTLPGREDYAWMPDGSIIMGDGSKLFLARPGGNAPVWSPDGSLLVTVSLTLPWTEIADLTDAGVIGITRLAINDTGTRIAIVGDRQ